MAYEGFVGRWSRLAATEFVEALGVLPSGSWLDVGCGAGALDRFLGGQGPAGAYVGSLDAGQREALAERIRTRLPYDSDGSIRLAARAWAVQGLK